MTAHHPIDHDDDSPPSQVTDDYWVYASRQRGRYRKPTVRSGKWLLFVPNEKIDEAWATIKRATEEGRLGGSAKAATARPNALTIDPLCVYL